MSNQWTFEEDMVLAGFEGVDADFIAQHDLGRVKGAGSRRVKILKESGAWAKMCMAIQAHEVAAAYHKFYFSRSREQRMYAASRLRDYGEDLTEEMKKVVQFYDDQEDEARQRLEELDASRRTRGAPLNQGGGE